jgi:DNA-binding transcriptional MerR regulator
MPRKEYSIQEVAQLTGVSVHTLRYYERIGLIGDVQRAASGHRRYSDDDIHWIKFLTAFRAAGMSISQIQAYLKLLQAGDATLPERRDLLIAHHRDMREQIRKLSETLAYVEHKIEWHMQEIANHKEEEEAG